MAIFDKISGISTGSGFKYQSEAPLDARLVVDYYSELAELVAATGAYAGMLVYVKNATTVNTITYPKGYYSYDGTAWTEFKGTDTPGDYNVQSDWNVTDTTSDAFIKNKPNVVLEGDARLTDARTPKTHNQAATTITEDTTHRFVTDTEKATWNAKSNFSGDYNDLTNKPTIPTKSSLGLDKVTNDAQVKRSEMGTANGVATLGSDGRVPTSQLPSYVDDVLEYTNKTAFPTTGESGKIYVDIAENKTYRWSGSSYIEISASLALGETSSTAYRGDRGKIAYDHSQATHAPVDAEKNVQSDWNVTDSTSDAFIKNKPAIPTVNNGTLTIQKNGVNVQTFTANQSTSVTANITVPTKVSELTNDSGFKTTDNNQTVKTGSVTFGANDVVEFVAGSNVSISGDATNKKITISATDTNTETTLTITDKTNTDTADLVYAVTSLVEGGTKGHAITPTYVGLPTKAYVDKMATGAVEYKGTVSALTGLSTTAGKGDFYRVSTQFTFGSETAHVGDILLATKDNPTQNVTDWDLIHTEVDSNTWVANSSTADGYVAKTNGAANKVWKTNASGVPSWQDDANIDTGATSVEVAGTGNAITAATYTASTRKLTLTKGATYATKTEVDALISSGTADPSVSTASQYYFKYN